MHPLRVPPLNNSSARRHSLRHYRAVIFDMDGVVTDTAQVHAQAWKKLFDSALEAVGRLEENREVVIADPDRLREFDATEDYLNFVDGMPREDGVRSFFASRDLTVPERISASADVLDAKEAYDFDGELTVQGLAELKQSFFDAVLDADGVTVFPDAEKLLKTLHSEGIPTALVSSSRNTEKVLTAGGVIQYFDYLVDGNTAIEENLEGKPHPAMFLRAAELMGVEPQDVAVLEDAVSGVQAAAAGGFGLVAGIDRLDDPGRLSEAGASVVTTDINDLELSYRVTRPFEPTWVLTFEGFDPVAEGNREVLCSLANGRWGTRASVPGTHASDIHYPGSYAAGLFNRLITPIQGREVETEHMVNLPDWTYVALKPEGSTKLEPTNGQLIDYRQELDMRRGLLTRTQRYQDPEGRITKVITHQFQSMAGEHFAALQFEVVAENWSGNIAIDTAINGQVTNSNVADDRQLANRHWTPAKAEPIEGSHNSILLQTRTVQSEIDVAMAVTTRFTSGVEDESVPRALNIAPDRLRINQKMNVTLEEGEPIVFEKIVAMTTSQEDAISTPALNSTKRLERVESFRSLLRFHEKMWGILWSQFAVEIGHDIMDRDSPLPVDTLQLTEPRQRHQLAINFHTFHVLQVAFGNREQLDASLPARGLSGEGYRGHLFWDEAYMYPMLTLRRPEYTRGLLLYRYRRLGEARALAAAEGYEGAMFPWQSGSDGREETPTELWNPRSNMWMPDNSHRQRHVSLAIAYSVLRYLEATKDEMFLSRYGAEMLVEICRFFISLTEYDPETDRFHINGVMGPDEYHDGYPDTPGSGLNDNAYTNVLTSWVLSSTISWLRFLDSRNDPLREWLHIFDEEIASWEEVAARLTIPFMEVDGRHIIAQFDGYADLLEFDWDGYREKYGNIGRLDLILQAEGDATNRYKLSKQADTLMLAYLFSAEELYEIMDRLGYVYDPDDFAATVDYYLHRTSHGSSLSRLVHGWVAARTDRSSSWELFTEGMEVDLSDTQGGTTREGVHLGMMAGTVDMVIRGYGGVETRDNTLRLHPQLPRELPRVKFALRFRNQNVTVEIDHEEVGIWLHPSSLEPIDINIEGREKTMSPGETWVVPLLNKIDA